MLCRVDSAAFSVLFAKRVLEITGNLTVESDVLIEQWVHLYFNGGLSIPVMFVVGDTIGRSFCFLYNGRNGRIGCLCLTRLWSHLVVQM